jgi:hypothetical protein
MSASIRRHACHIDSPAASESSPAGLHRAADTAITSRAPITRQARGVRLHARRYRASPPRVRIFVIEAGTRHVHVQARNLLMYRERATWFRFLIRNRAGQLFTDAFDAMLTAAGIEVVKFLPGSPRANDCAERYVRTAQAECTDWMLIAGLRHRTGLLGTCGPPDAAETPTPARMRSSARTG